MKITDENHFELIESAFREKTDVAFPGFELPSFDELIQLCSSVNTVVLLPSKLYTSRSDNVSVFSRYDTVFSPAKLCFADAHLMSTQAFRDYLENCDFRRMIIPFAELIDETEYGYCRGYRWVNEWRAETLHYCQLITLFSSSHDTEKYSAIWNAGQCLCLNLSFPDKEYRVISCRDEKDKLSRALSETTKFAGRNTIVYFNTRTEADSFTRLCQSRAASVALVTGETTSDSIRATVNGFRKNAITVIAGTKSALSLFPVIKPQSVIICGIPFSENHLNRCLLTGTKGTVIYTDSDVLSARRLIENYVLQYCEGAGESIGKAKLSALEKIKMELDG